MGSWQLVVFPALTMGEGILDPRRAQRLASLCLICGKSFDGYWNENFRSLQAYKKKYGHCQVVTTGSNVKYSRFVSWVPNQRIFRSVLGYQNWMPVYLDRYYLNEANVDVENWLKREKRI
jgi:hypothetical protein